MTYTRLKITQPLKLRQLQKNLRQVVNYYSQPFHASDFLAYSIKNRGGKSGRKCHDDACRNVTNLTSQISLGPRNFVPRHQSLAQTAPNSRTALSKAFTDTPTAIYPRKGTCERVSEASPNHGSP